jgi:hypothetical protein
MSTASGQGRVRAGLELVRCSSASSRSFDGRHRPELSNPSRRLGLGVQSWKAHFDVEIPAGLRSDGEVSRVGAGNGVDDGEAEPEAVVALTFSGTSLEGLEEPVEVTCGRDGAVVGDREADMACLRWPRLPDRAPRVRSPLGCD